LPVRIKELDSFQRHKKIQFIWILLSNIQTCELSQAGEESESQTRRPYPYCQPAGHSGRLHQESLQPAWRWESIWTSAARLV